VRFPKGKVFGVDQDGELRTIPLGKGELIKEGKELLIAFGSLVLPALEAANQLKDDGIDLAVVNARFAKPLDEDLILSYAKRGSVIITAEEGVLAGGFGSAVRELLDRRKIFDVRFKSIGLPDEIYPLGKADEVKKMFKLDPDGLSQQIRQFYEK
jgi:1-deoxy-D-xylulose-5-phosphate synthase